jgi:hypothetical protein
MKILEYGVLKNWGPSAKDVVILYFKSTEVM